MTRRVAAGVSILLFAAAVIFAAAQDTSHWKRYRNSQYGFEIAYPADWAFDANYEDNYGRPPSGNRPPAYAGETRNLFRLEMDGPDQSHEGGGYFEDGAIIAVRITGTRSGKRWDRASGAEPIRPERVARHLEPRTRTPEPTKSDVRSRTLRRV